MERSPLFAGWRSCPRCGSKLEVSSGEASCRSCGLAAYANPAPTASALLLDDEGRVLLARRANDPGEGKWDLLGGFIEEGEGALEALEREVREETGLEIEPGEFVGAFPDRYGEDGIYTINLYWTARARDGELRLDDELMGVAWFTPDGLPSAEEFAFANTVEALEEWKARRVRRNRH